MTNEKETVNKADMPQSVKTVPADQMTVEQWLAIRKEAALHIDPETAEVEWMYVQFAGPCGVNPKLWRAYFARAPGSEVFPPDFRDLKTRMSGRQGGMERSIVLVGKGKAGVVRSLAGRATASGCE